MASPSLQGTIGAIQIGSIFSVFLFGIETLQTHIYFQTFKDDRWELKSLVLGLWILELAHTFCVAAEVYKITVIFYGQLSKIFPFPYIGASSLLGGVIAFLVHAFFTYRCYRVLPKRWNLIGAACFVAAFARFVASLVLGVQAAQARDLVVYRQWFTTSPAVESSTARLIDSVVHYSIGELTALHSFSMINLNSYRYWLTSMGTITMIIVYYCLRHTLEWLAIYTYMAKLYSNSLLATLNSRSGIRTGLSQGSSSIDPSQFRVGGRSRNPVSMVTTVEMKTTVHTVRGEPENLDKSYGLGPDPRKDDNGIAI
ncbi:hypothetical protein BKA70DRAFT_1417299 [Coprinopsis sp. MPI-PUGE-AT-0042]|nr:hypothetical protein BKA70DRAFT_1417299 [Coprinopsis sp. MPI-PUGE-AT-0042]